MAILFGTQCPFSEKTSAEHYNKYVHQLKVDLDFESELTVNKGIRVLWVETALEMAPEMLDVM